MTRFGIIYLITCVTNSKKYIGQTVYNAEIRFKGHCKKRDNTQEGCPALRAAIFKYGKENFTTEEIFTAFSREALNEAEKILIKQYNTLSPNGYNIDEGGNQPQITKESIEKANLKRAYLIEAKPVSGGQSVFFRGRNSAHLHGFEANSVGSSLRRGNIHKGHIFSYVNQSGSVENKNSSHAQRLDFETLPKREYKKSTSRELVPNTELLKIKDEIISYYLHTSSSYKTAVKFNTDATRIKKLLKTWGVMRTLSESASIRNQFRYGKR